MAINVKRIIADTICELSLEKPLSKISVTDISERSGISRQTFYNHFKDRNDLIRWVFVRTLDGWEICDKEGYYAYLCDIYRKALNKRQFLKQACKESGQNSLVEEIFIITYNYHRNHILKQVGPGPLDHEVEYALHFDAYGSSYCYVDWLMRRIPMEPEKVALSAYESMPDILRPYFK